jgi:hypothetical protein
MESSSLDEALHTPNTLMAYGSCPQTSSFPSLPVYHYLAYSDDWSENPSLGNFFLHLDKDLASIPYSIGSFDLASYPSRSWETLPAIYTGHSTFVLSLIPHSRIWGCQTQLCPYRPVVNSLRIIGFLPYPSGCMVRTLVVAEIYL